jgi:hypothetical protein
MTAEIAGEEGQKTESIGCMRANDDPFASFFGVRYLFPYRTESITNIKTSDFYL